jgi:prepilin peptidase CpaA
MGLVQLHPLHPVVHALLAALVIVAAATDLRSRRIYNWLTAPAVAAGFAAHPAVKALAGASPIDGLIFAAAGFGLALLIFVPLFALRAFGGGDVKLMVAVGALAGAGNLFMIFLVDAVLGGIAALVLAAARGRLWRTLRNVGRILKSLARGLPPYVEHEELQAGHEKSLGLPRGVTIALAVLLVQWAAG